MKVLRVQTCTICDANTKMVTLSLSKTDLSKLMEFCPVLVAYSMPGSGSSCGVIVCMETFLDTS